MAPLARSDRATAVVIMYFIVNSRWATQPFLAFRVGRVV
jgi:hypothetical protein